MFRISSLLVCASLLACVASQTIITTTAGPQPTPTPIPTPTPMPKNEYTLKDAKNHVCLRMVADIDIMFEYETADDKTVKSNYTLVSVGANVNKNLSSCENASQLVLYYNSSNMEATNYVIFTFIETSDKMAWTALPVQFNFTVTKKELPDESELIDDRLSYTSTENFLGQNVDPKKSYMCKSKEDVKFDSSSTNDTFKVTMRVTDLQVQAYYQSEEGNENFGDAVDCAADSNKGNKIVPIAVGAALAGLVIVVLIAYLIGRLKSRRQSSYEALS